MLSRLWSWLAGAAPVQGVPFLAAPYLTEHAQRASEMVNLAGLVYELAQPSPDTHTLAITGRAVVKGAPFDVAALVEIDGVGGTVYLTEQGEVSTQAGYALLAWWSPGGRVEVIKHV